MKKVLSRAHVSSLEKRARNAHDQNEQTIDVLVLISQCFTFRMILLSYAILCGFVLYSHYGDSILSKKLNGHQTFASLSLLCISQFQA